MFEVQTSSGLSKGASIGVGVGVGVFALALGVLTAGVFFRVRKNKKAALEEERLAQQERGSVAQANTPGGGAGGMAYRPGYNPAPLRSPGLSYDGRGSSGPYSPPLQQPSHHRGSSDGSWDASQGYWSTVGSNGQQQHLDQQQVYQSHQPGLYGGGGYHRG